jgi:hypothetical protein
MVSDQGIVCGTHPPAQLLHRALMQPTYLRAAPLCTINELNNLNTETGIKS